MSSLSIQKDGVMGKSDTGMNVNLQWNSSIKFGFLVVVGSWMAIFAGCHNASDPSTSNPSTTEDSESTDKSVESASTEGESESSSEEAEAESSEGTNSDNDSEPSSSEESTGSQESENEVSEEASDDEASDGETSGDETSGDETSGDETSDDSSGDTVSDSDDDTSDSEFECEDLRTLSEKPASLDRKIVAYYSAWSIYDRSYFIDQIPGDQISHINYAFANIANGECVLGDPWADRDKVFGNETTDYKGNFGQLANLKAKYPHLKTLISVGGWTWSDHFSSVAKTEQSRARFVDSCIKFMNDYGFDGIDIDWEYPVEGGEEGNETSPDDKQNYTLLMQDFRRELDRRGSSSLLTIASAGATSKLANYELSKLAKVLDWINVMSYDFRGGWENLSGHHAPLCPSKLDQSNDASAFNVNASVQTLLDEGVPSKKVVVGIPFYGRGWSGASGGEHGLYTKTTGVSPGTWEPGVVDYWDISKNHLMQGFERHWDENAMVPWIYHKDKEVVISYEDLESISMKAKYIRARGLGGAMVWELCADKNHQLLGRLSSEL